MAGDDQQVRRSAKNPRYRAGSRLRLLVCAVASLPVGETIDPDIWATIQLYMAWAAELLEDSPLQLLAEGMSRVPLEASNVDHRKPALTVQQARERLGAIAAAIRTRHLGGPGTRNARTQGRSHVSMKIDNDRMQR